jgi:hypothetical protein
LQTTNRRTTGTFSKQELKRHQELPDQELYQQLKLIPKPKLKPISKLTKLHPKRLQWKPTKILKMSMSQERLMNTTTYEKTSTKLSINNESRVHI